MILDKLHEDIMHESEIVIWDIENRVGNHLHMDNVYIQIIWIGSHGKL